MGKITKYILFILSAAILIFAGYLFIGSVEPAEEIAWGVNFSQKQAESLGLDWQGVFISLLQDLRVRNLKLITYWDLLEKSDGKYDFDDLDWQIEQVQKYGARTFLVIGMKTPRWPECHEPEWVRAQNSNLKIQNSLLEYVETLVNRYKDSDVIWAWQVENEPFFPFGECPKGVLDKSFLKKEISLVKSLDNKNRPVIISDSGEFSFWIEPARLGDIVGTTLHRKVWFKELKRYIKYPLKPIFYWRKSLIINKLFGKQVIVGELQSEPWCLKYLDECPLAEQDKTMNLEYFKENIEFAKNTGLKEIYLWGTEWWFWMKEKQNDSRIWDEAKKLF